MVNPNAPTARALAALMSFVMAFTLMPFPAHATGNGMSLVPAVPAASLAEQASDDTFTADLADAARGTAGNPYRISTEADLFAFADAVNGGNAFPGKYVRLEDDIALTYELDGRGAWDPIGAGASTPFKGNFAGNGKAVSNFKVGSNAVGTSSAGVYLGFFGYVGGSRSSDPTASITGFKLVGAHVADDDADVQGNLTNAFVYSGGLVGGVSSRPVAISNCYVDVNVKGFRNVGGFVGSAGASGSNLVIDNCVSRGTITGVDAGSPAADSTVSAYVGGFVGIATWSTGSNSFSVANSLFLGQVVPSEACMTDASVAVVFRRSGNALVGRAGNSNSVALPDAAISNSYYVAQAANAGGADRVQAARAGSAGTVAQVKGNVVDAPTVANAAAIAKAVNGGQSPQAWRVEDGAVPVPEPFGEAVDYPLDVHFITYELNGGDWASGYAGPRTQFAAGGEAVSLPVAADVVRAGYSFKGWHDNPGFTGGALAEVSPDAYSGDVALYAKWARACTVTFDAGAGAFAGSGSTQELEEGDTVARPPDPTPPAGKTFVGWYNGDAEWDFSTTLTAANASLALVARYRGELVDVAFDPNGGELGSGMASSVAVEKGAAVAKPAADPVRPGCDFTGWRLRDALAGYDFDTPVNEAITLLATWEVSTPALDMRDARYNLADAQYVRGELRARALGAPATANGGEVAYEWYRSASPMASTADEQVGTGATLVPGTDAVGTSYYYCYISHTVAGMTGELTTSPVKVEVLESASDISGTYDTSDDPVRISTQADLEAFRTGVNSGSLASRDAVLLHDVDLRDAAWTPIGCISGLTNGKANAAGTVVYSGTFDGLGHTVSGLNASSDVGGVGLFGYVDGNVVDGEVVGGRVQNLIVQGRVASGGPCAAGVVAMAGEHASFANVGNEATVSSTYSNMSYGYTGGVVGKAEHKDVSFAGCYNKGDVTGMNHVGGVCGYGGTAVDCYNLGSVTAQRTGGYAGGILGDGNGGATGCYGYGKTGTASGAYYGAILASGSTMASCYYHSGNTDRAHGGYTAGNATAFSTAADLLASLPPEIWRDGAEVNSSHASMPALYWESSAREYHDVVVGAVSPSGAGAFTVDKARAAEGDTVTVVAAPGEAMVADAITVVKAGGGMVPVSLVGAVGTFAMPPDDVTVSVAFADAPAVEYAVNVIAPEHGTLSASPVSARCNATVTVTATPDSGYEVASITAMHAGGVFDVTPTATGGTFRMPAGDVAVSAVFRQYSHHTVRITVLPIMGELLPPGLSIVLVDKGTGARVPHDFITGTTFRFDGAIEGHAYSVAVETPGYTLAEAVEFTAGQGTDAMTTRTAQLAYEAAERAVTFDPGEGAFPSEAGFDLVGGKLVKTVPNGAAVIAPSADPVRVGYVFGGWYDGETQFSAGAPVTEDVVYLAKWIDQSQVEGTFLTDLAGSERDGSYARPYRIATERDLYDFARVVNGCEPHAGEWADYNGGAARSLAGLYVSLENDIALTGPVTPVGIGSGASVAADVAVSFSGTFLGNNHTISNFSVSVESNPEWTGSTQYGTKDTKHLAGAYSALFGSVAGATIQDVRVQVAAGGLSLNGPVAGLVAQVGAGTTRIGHCAVDGAVSATGGESGAAIAGGLIGVYAPGSAASTLAVDHSYQDGAVDSVNVAGGLVGSVGGNGLSVTASYHAGAVSGAVGHVGSFIGDASTSSPKSSVVDCVTELPVASAPVAGGAAAGGCEAPGTLAGKDISEWAGDEVKALLGTEFFDFANLKDDGTVPFGAVTWEQGHMLVFEAPDAGVTGSAPVVSKQSAGAKVIIPSCTLERAGYELSGWRRADAGSDPRVYMPDAVFTMPDADVTLVAQWDAVPYGISYDLGGKGTWKEGAPTVTSYTVESAVTLPGASELEGFAADGVRYEFAGWYDDAAFEGDAVAEVPAGQVGSRKLYAKWSAVEDPASPEAPGGEPGGPAGGSGEPSDGTGDVKPGGEDAGGSAGDAGGGSGGSGGSGTPAEPGEPDAPSAPTVCTQVMYRLYNPNSGEHFYTAVAGERDSLVAAGWNDEGEAWTAPVTSGSPVYRLYNSHERLGDHHYTTSKEEYDHLVSVGWTGEGVGWYSDDSEGEGLHRLYNPNAYPSGKTGAHHYTASAGERDFLVAAGWLDEGYGWYGVK